MAQRSIEFSTGDPGSINNAASALDQMLSRGEDISQINFQRDGRPLNLSEFIPTLRNYLDQYGNPHNFPNLMKFNPTNQSIAPTTPASVVPTGPNQPSVPVDTPPLPNIPGLSTPQTPDSPATPLQTPVNAPTAPSDISPYIPTTSQQQQDIINQSIAQSQGVARQNVQSLQDILNPYVTSQVKNWTDPNSPDYQATIGALNNQGRADSNTFGQSLASRLAPLIATNQMTLGTNALQPSFTTQQGLVNSGAGIQSGLGLASLQRFINQADFDKQAALSNQLADKGIPSNFQQGAGTASSLLGGLGGFFQGLPGLKQATSGTWICTHLKKLGLATEAEVEAVHAHLISSIYRHPMAWIHYILRAPELISLCDEAALDWKEIKPVLIDAVLQEPNTEKAWQIYRFECQRLALKYAPQLWSLEVIA